MKYPKLRELKEAIKALIKGPYTSKFPYQPHKPYQRFRGRPEFHEEDCIGCTACAEVCPVKAIEVSDGKNKRFLTVHWDICVYCGQCQANCLTTKGIILSNKFDLATTGKREDLNQKIEKELVICSYCQEPIAPYDQLLWVAKRLGPLCFSNASLMLLYLNNLGLTKADDKNPPQETEFYRPDRIKVLCPACRRQAVLKS